MKDPNDDEFDRTAAVLTQMFFIRERRMEGASDVAAISAIYLLTWKRYKRNVLTQWEIDQDQTFKEATNLLRRHSEIVRVISKVISDSADHKFQEVFSRVVKAGDVEEIERSLSDLTSLRSRVVRYMEKFALAVKDDEEED